jgi:biopolymer transport protein TolQ
MLLHSLSSLAQQPAEGAPKLDPVALVLHASTPVKAVLIILVAFSLLCWLTIGAKALHLARARGESKRFLDVFDQTPSFDAIGYDEMRRVTGGRAGRLDEAQATHVESTTRRAAAQEVAHLESWMGLLGTIGSTSPFIGLFGTVYGIMDAFLSIGNQQNANLPVVAPKIAEALIATAIGLVAAIPAVMAYNYFVRKVQVIADSMEGFAEDVAARAKLGGV